jgi:hypothetical protein
MKIISDIDGRPFFDPLPALKDCRESAAASKFGMAPSLSRFSVFLDDRATRLLVAHLL